METASVLFAFKVAFFTSVTKGSTFPLYKKKCFPLGGSQHEVLLLTVLGSRLDLSLDSRTLNFPQDKECSQALIGTTCQTPTYLTAKIFNYGINIMANFDLSWFTGWTVFRKLFLKCHSRFPWWNYPEGNPVYFLAQEENVMFTRHARFVLESQLGWVSWEHR